VAVVVEDPIKLVPMADQAAEAVAPEQMLVEQELQAKVTMEPQHKRPVIVAVVAAPVALAE
jgi:hypothetical protein